ncbi:MAG: single-stranded DNA-binding protein [Ferruginibacter sp.]
MIKLQIVGNLGKDCIVKEVNGKNVINFSVVHSERYKDSQGVQKERATWVECAYWSDRTAIAPYLTKGQMIYAEGYPEADAYMNKDNQAAATLRMRVQNIQLLGSSKGENSGQHSGQNSGAVSNMASSTQAVNTSPIASIPVADDLPF